MTKTNSGLCAYARAKVGCYYWMGTYGQLASKSLYNAKKKQYPKYYTASDFEKQIANPKQVFDCAGLIKGYLWTDSIDGKPKYNSKSDYGATGFYNSAKSKGKISTFKKINGQLVFKGTADKKSHVGIYCDGYVYEAKGHAYGVIKSKFNSSWTYWAQCHLIVDDTSKPQPSPEPTPTPTPAPKPDKLQPAQSFNTAYNGTWKVTASSLNMRYGAGTEWGIITSIPNGKHVRCYGYYTRNDGTDWLCVVYGNNTGYCSKKYLKKV